MTTIIDLSGLNSHLDAANLNILLTRAMLFLARTEPQVGDFVRMLDGTFRRFTHDWDTDIQTTYVVGDPKPTDHSYAGSFYLTIKGEVSHSGSLDDAISKSTLLDSGEKHVGTFWFFKNNHWRAHNGVEVFIPCKVWIQQRGEL